MNGVSDFFKRDLARFKERMGNQWVDDVEYAFRDPDKNCGLVIGGMSTETRASNSERGCILPSNRERGMRGIVMKSPEERVDSVDGRNPAPPGMYKTRRK